MKMAVKYLKNKGNVFVLKINCKEVRIFKHVKSAIDL